MKVQQYPETHVPASYITVENHFDFPLQGDIGVQVASDGRIWVCINGIAFIRSTPHPNRLMVR